MRFAEVAVDAPAGHGRTFSYSFPDSLDLQPGRLVRVTFGAQRLQGIVFSLEAAPKVPETRDVLGVVDAAPYLTPVQLDLARWVSEYYLCSLFEAASPMLPPGSRARPRVVVSLGPKAEEAAGALTEAQRRVVEYVRRQGPVDRTRLVRAMGTWAEGAVTSLSRRGVLAVTGGPERKGVAAKYVVVLSLRIPTSDIEARLAEMKRAPRQAALLAALASGRGQMEAAEARREYGSGAVKALLERGWAADVEERVQRDPLAGKAFAATPPVTLTAAQSAAAQAIRAALEDASATPRAFLLQGVTGSGKTEVYLDAVGRCLALGKRAIVLVPEIALTHQTIERLEGRFSGQVAVQHSGLTAGERFDQWWEVKQGAYGVVVGSRSAVFAPQPDLGLVVVDEEHEWTYKQEEASPRYHAREVALRLASLTGAAVVMGSASPDVESYRRAERGAYRLLTLPERVTGSPTGGASPLAAVEVVDMRRELREGNTGMFSRALSAALERCLESGGQAILFLNRRGTSSMMCRGCGAIVRCSRCDVALTYHEEAQRLICHQCGQRRAQLEQCAKCLAFTLGFYGTGTQGVAAEVARRFPGMRVLRWDRDTSKSAGDVEAMLTAFQDGEARVLVGTQMVAKGLHFPSVTLVGVVAADIGLGVPDFRAGERTFQLLCQVAGRAGRGEKPGRVVVQTFQPENYAVRAAATQDYPTFYQQELRARQEQGNPPFSRLVRLTHAHTNAALAEREALRLAAALREERDAAGMGDPQVLGPVPAFPPRLRGHYRWQVLLRGAKPRALLDKTTIPREWTVDVDPVGP
ncbi:MAG: primosomal protein N' [SAR202 cluster bacterium]|nr:primosomal protein N' [SAR202 cluster bacterium]